MPDERQTAPTLPPLPEGFRYLYNRTDAEYEGQFDGRVYILQPHETKPLLCQVAEHLRHGSIIPGTLRRGEGRQAGTLTSERALALGPGWTILRWNKTEGADQLGNNVYQPEYTEAEAEADFGVPTTTKPGMELFDRSSIPNYVDRTGQDGRTTHVEYVRT